MYHPPADQSTEPTNRLEGAPTAPDTSLERTITTLTKTAQRDWALIKLRSHPAILREVHD
jgi:hypothetical protein